MSDVQQRLDVDVNYASQYRLRLIAAELIYSTRRGYVDFALPYLREYLREHAAADVQDLSKTRVSLQPWAGLRSGT